MQHRKHPQLSLKELKAKLLRAWERSPHKHLYIEHAKQDADRYQVKLTAFCAQTNQFGEVERYAKETMDRIRSVAI